MNGIGPTIRLLLAHGMALAMTMAYAPFAAATFFDLNGVVEDCNAFACGLAGIAVEDPIGGYLQVDDAAAAPNSTFTQTDIVSAQIVVGGLDSGPSNGPFGDTSLTTDANGEISAGTVLITVEVDTGIGTAEVEITLNANDETWMATTGFFGLGEVASGSLTFARRDSDGDGVADDFDNCSAVANPDQRDTNGDLFGNQCDPDLNNDGVVNPTDLGLFRAAFFNTGSGLDADFNGDGVVNPIDLGILRAYFFGPPGPSGLAP